MSTDICRWLFLLLFLATWTKYSNSKEIRVVCYYTNWSVYRPGTAKFSPQNINPYLCTHLIYAFGGFTKENTLKPFDKYQDIEKGGYAKFTGLKTYNKNLKTMLAIGGWNEGSSRFSPMVANPDRRKELIKNAIKFLRQNHFDGLDLDWEYPSFRDGGKSRDRDNYAQLVQELREEFERESEKTGRQRLLLTMAVPAGIEYIKKGYDVPKLTKYLDWMNILSYDYHSAFEPAVNHHAPLYPLEEPSEYNYDTELNIDYTIQHYLKNGADPNKLVLGIPTYGRSYTLFNPDANEIGAPADGPGDMGEATRENGYLAYYEICEYIKTQDWEVVQPNPDAMGPYAFKDNQWVGYDDDDIARKKAAYVAENGLGGIMFWSIDNDDFRGTCHGKPYPIIEAAKEALISAYGLTDENLVSPPAKSVKPKTRTRTSSKTSSGNEETEKKVSNSGGSRRRNRVKNKSDSSSGRAKIRRKETRRTTEGPVYSSLELVTPSYTTPAPPPTPGMGGEFKCEDEGFYPHPKDCKKYFWCLSGAGDSGIIAHQFTCPAGLYFNKAADSCDYTRNVLCNKKLSKTTTTTTTEATTSKTTPSTTVRVAPKITAATSRTTVFRTSTTTEAYEDEYEYEDEEENDNSEEDPKVIKELLDLIKRAGGIAELEKQLKIQEDGTASVSHPDATTPSSISKSLVERVLGKAAAKNKDAGRKNTYNFLNRNSRGPQNEGLKASEDKEKQERGRPQYTTISRQRAQKSNDDDETEDEEEEKKEETPRKYAKKQPEYVNIRRGRVSSTTEEPEEDTKQQINRNKILGEEIDEDETDDEEEPVRKKFSTPQYVNIRRQRPSTTEETSTSKYTVIRRGTTEADLSDDSKKRGSTTASPDEEETQGKKRGTTIASDTSSSTTEKTDSKSKYKILRRGSTSTTEAPSEDTGTTPPSKRRGTTLPSAQDVSEKTKTRATVSPTSTTAEKYKILKRGSTTEAPENAEDNSEDVTLKDLTSSRLSSTTPETNQDVTTNSETENPVTVVEQILITSPESLTIKTTASISSTNRPSELSKTDSKLTDSTGEGVVQTQTPQLLEPRPFSLSTNSPASSVKAVTESTTRVTKVSDQNYKLRLRPKLPGGQSDVISTTTLTTEKPTPFRAPSRFKQSFSTQADETTTRATIKPSVRSRKRFSTTTEQYSDSEESDLNRPFRPSEIADLSSLTAVDFSSLKGLNRFNSPSRPRRPRPSVATTTTTQKPEESLKTSSRTLPLARKLLDGTTFGKSRRVISKNDQIVEDQINSSSDTTHRIRPFTRAPSSFTITSTTEETTRQTLRNRKIIRRLRPTSSSKPQNLNEGSNQIVFKKRLVRPSSTAATETENLIENASSNSLFNRRFPRPSTTLAEEINKLSTTEALEKSTTELSKEDDEQNETSDDVSAEEGENIRLSESNIRENSNLNVLSDDDDKKVRRKVLKRIKSKFDDEKPTTEPNVIIRTRKIIRKLTTESTIASTATPTTTETAEISTFGRRRKIIRRLRPTTATSTEPSTEKTLHIRGRPFLASSTTEKSIDNVETELSTKSEDFKNIEIKPFKPKYQTLTRTTTPSTKPEDINEEDDDSKKDSFVSKYKTFSRSTALPDSDTTSTRTIDRSKYSILNRGTTSTTTERTVLADVEEEFEKEVANVQSQPRYRIYRPTIFHDEDEDEENDDTEDKDTIAPKYRILRPALNINEDEDETDEEPLKIRILRPNENEESEISIIRTADPEVTRNSTETSEVQIDDKSTESSESFATEDSRESSTEQEENKTEENDEDSTETTEADITTTTTTTTAKPYVNPILSRQKNRPAFVRPKLTTKVPSRTVSDNKPRYKSFSRSTSNPTKSRNVEGDDENKKPERKFVPKGFTRTRYSTTEQEIKPEVESTSPETVKANVTEREEVSYNVTSEIPPNESYNTSETYNDTKTDTEDVTEVIMTSTELPEFSQTTQEYISPENVTDSYATNSTLNEFNDATNGTTIDNENLTPELTTVTILDLTTVKDVIEEKDETTLVLDTSTTSSSINTTTEITTETSSKSTLSFNETTVNYSESSTDTTESAVTESTLTYYSQSTPLTENETTINYSETSSVSTESTTSETTPVYHPKSTLRSFQNRPKYSVPKRLTSTENPNSPARSSSRFNQRNRGQVTKSRLITPNLRSTTPISPPKNRFIYNRYSTTERNRFVTNLKTEEPELEEEEEIDDDLPKEDDIEEENQENVYALSTSTTSSPRISPSQSRPRVSNRPEGPNFKRTTEAPKVNEDLSDIDTEAVKARNKNLFSKKRKMNVPFAGYNQNDTNITEEKVDITATTESTTSTTETSPLTTTPAIVESVTKPTKIEETTEHLTTLHHVFAETELSGDKGFSTETTTNGIVEEVTNSTKSKVEKLIEVNRIVEVHGMNSSDLQKDNKVIDKVGVINRVTVVKVVDGNPNPEENEVIESTSTSSNETTTEVVTVKEVHSDVEGGVLKSEQPSDRQDRKYEVYGVSKIVDYKKDGKPNAEIIDGISNINIITPRPYYSTEASTISLEALFQTDTPQKLNNINVNLLKTSNDDELLETGNSRYINVRIFEQEGEEKAETQIVPIRVPKQDDYITMKAEVVEVTPKVNKEFIKIVPIQVEMSRKLIIPSDFNRKIENGVPKVNFQILKPENK